MSEEIANVDMARAWDGEEGDQWTQFADEYDDTNRSIWARFLETDPIGRADQVLDIGCGCGQSTRDAARLAHEGSALGVDLSSSMLAVARRRATAEGVTNVDFRQADAQVYAFDPGAFDIAISRFGVMFFENRTAAFTNIAAALRPGGRLAVLAWQDVRKNEWIMTVRETLAAGRDLPMPPAGAAGPMALADQDDVRSLLSGAGFESVGFTSIEEPVWFGADAEAAYEFVGEIGIVKGLSDGLDADTKAAAHERLTSSTSGARNARGGSVRQRRMADFGDQGVSKRREAWRVSVDDGGVSAANHPRGALVTPERSLRGRRPRTGQVMRALRTAQRCRGCPSACARRGARTRDLTPPPGLAGSVSRESRSAAQHHTPERRY